MTSQRDPDSVEPKTVRGVICTRYACYVCGLGGYPEGDKRGEVVECPDCGIKMRIGHDETSPRGDPNAMIDNNVLQLALQGRIHHRFIDLERLEMTNARELIKALASDLKTHVDATEATENRIIDAEFKATALERENGRLRAVVDAARKMPRRAPSAEAPP